MELERSEHPHLDTDLAIRVWARDRDHCKCARPVEGPVHLHIKYCRICRLPLRRQVKR